MIPLRSVNIKLMPIAYSSNQIRSAYVKDLDIHHFHDVCGFQKNGRDNTRRKDARIPALIPLNLQEETCPVLL